MAVHKERCHRGHDEWSIVPRSGVGTLRRYCRACRRWRQSFYRRRDATVMPAWSEHMYSGTVEFVNELIALGAASLQQICDWTGWNHERARRQLYRLRRREIVRRTRSGLWVVADHIEPSPEPWNESAGYQEGT